MKKILVLVDFSGPSINAVAYAADLALDRGLSEIVLMSNCFVPLFEQIVPSPDLTQVGPTEIRTRMEKLMQQLVEVKAEIEKKLTPTVEVRITIGTQPLLRSVLRTTEEEAPSLVIIGSSSRDIGEDCSIGRQIIPLAKVIPAPVLVIPPESRYTPVRTALVASQTEPSPDAISALFPLFGELQYRQYRPTGGNVLNAVLKTAEEQQAQLIVALPRKHSFFYNLTYQNIMHGVLLNSTEPVLILK